MPRNSRIDRSSSTIRMSPVSGGMAWYRWGSGPLARDQDQEAAQVAQPGQVTDQVFDTGEQLAQRGHLVDRRYGRHHPHPAHADELDVGGQVGPGLGDGVVAGE